MCNCHQKKAKASNITGQQSILINNLNLTWILGLVSQINSIHFETLTSVIVCEVSQGSLEPRYAWVRVQDECGCM